MRSLAAAERAEQRAVDRHNRQVTRAAEQGLRQLDRSSERLLKKAAAFEAKLEKDPIKALKLAYWPQDGFVAEPFVIDTEVMNGSISLLPPGGAVGFFAPIHETPTCRVRVLDVRIATFGTLIAFQVDSGHSEYRIRLSWMKKSSPAESPAYITDPASGQYLYPKATSLTGEVVPGQSKIGIMVFEPFRIPTHGFELHVSGVKVGPERGAKGKATFKFEYQSPSLAQEIQNAIVQPSLSHRVSTEVERVASQQAAMIHQAHEQHLKKQGGCGCPLALLALVPGAGALFELVRMFA